MFLSFFCCTSLSSIWTLFSISHITLAYSFFAILASLSHFDLTRASICDSSSCSLFWTSLLICAISCYRVSWKLPVCKSCTPAALYFCALAFPSSLQLSAQLRDLFLLRRARSLRRRCTAQLAAGKLIAEVRNLRLQSWFC